MKNRPAGIAILAVVAAVLGVLALLAAGAWWNASEGLAWLPRPTQIHEAGTCDGCRGSGRASSVRGGSPPLDDDHVGVGAGAGRQQPWRGQQWSPWADQGFCCGH
jgi:hypothetical protein